MSVSRFIGTLDDLYIFWFWAILRVLGRDPILRVKDEKLVLSDPDARPLFVDWSLAETNRGKVAKVRQDQKRSTNVRQGRKRSHKVNQCQVGSQKVKQEQGRSVKAWYKIVW